MSVLWRLMSSLLPLAVCAACSSPADKDMRPTLAVSVAPQASLLKAIAGDDFDVVTVLGGGANPETFEPGMATRLAVDKSAAYFTTGGHLPFEAALGESLADDVRIVNTGYGIEPAYGTHGGNTDGDHPEGGADPHVWTSLVNLAVMVDNMTTALAELNPAHEAIYVRRADSLLTRLDSIDENYRRRLADAPARAFAVWHPSLSYFARDYGLRQIALGQEHKELSALRLKSLIDSAAREGTRVFFFQREYDSRQAATANERIGSRLVTIDPLSPDWEEQMDLIVDELTRH